MEYMDGASLAATVLVITSVCGVLAAVWKGVEAYRCLAGTERRRAERSQVRKSLDGLDARLTVCEERLQRENGDMMQLLTVLNAMLMHFISGNDHEKLRGVKEELDRYMASR